MKPNTSSPPIRVFQLGSGSAGNLTALDTAEGIYLVDVGFTGREVIRRLKLVGLDPKRVVAMILTHCHLDHARGAAILARRLKVPIWGTSFTLDNLGKLRGTEELHGLPDRGLTMVRELSFATHPASHDIPGTVLLKVNNRIGFASDLGVADPEVVAFLDDLEGLLLEFNYDMDMLAKGPYPESLKRRIASPRGHLENQQAREILCTTGFRRPHKALWLTHLSQKNNAPGLAISAAQAAMQNSPAKLVPTGQNQVQEPVIFF